MDIDEVSRIRLLGYSFEAEDNILDRRPLRRLLDWSMAWSSDWFRRTCNQYIDIDWRFPPFEVLLQQFCIVYTTTKKLFFVEIVANENCPVHWGAVHRVFCKAPSSRGR
jgi:hypothetical protein